MRQTIHHLYLLTLLVFLTTCRRDNNLQEIASDEINTVETIDRHEERPPTENPPNQFYSEFDETGALVYSIPLENYQAPEGVNCDGPLIIHCCYLNLIPPNPNSPIQFSGLNFGIVTRCCEPGYYLWIKVRRVVPPTPPAILPGIETFWENSTFVELLPCLSVGGSGLVWPSAPSGRYFVEAEIRTGTQHWVAPHPFKPWLGGYWDDDYCARDSETIDVP